VKERLPHPAEPISGDSPLPSGTVTFWFSDIEGSTTRWERDRAAMQEALRRHDALMRGAIEAHGGYVFKTIGDAFCAVFRRPEDALAAALDVQQTLLDEDFSAVDGVRVRIALHAGTADERDGDYFGPTVNRVARLLATAHGGQVVLSRIVAEMVRDTLPSGAELRDLGEHRLKDLAQAEHVFQLVSPNLAADFPPLLSLSVLNNNLPQQLTSLIGREQDIAAIDALIAEHRLVTLSGSGGVGKTRAALQVGADLLDGSGDGVWFVDLAPLQDSAFVASAVGSALGVQQSSTRPELETIVQYLKKRRLLLIVDNCEHVIAEAAHVVEAILHACPEVRVLATSREPLEIGGEQVYRLPSLAVPPNDAQPSAEEALQYGAIALFVERSQAADARFMPTDETAPIIADIVRRLDGIPLAIELAAARVKVLSIPDLAQRLDERFRLLTGGRRTALPRQQTLRALIDWSYDLLSEQEKALLRRVGVFAGGWTLEAAESVCTDDALKTVDMLDLSSSLVEKSLVVADLDGEATRYRLLESTRAYARERLAESGERSSLACRHANWVADFAGRMEEARVTTPLERWLREVEPELENARAALSWALGADGDVVAAVRIAGRMTIYWNARLVGEGRRWLEASLERLDEAEEPADAARAWLAIVALSVGTRRLEAAQRSRDLYERVGDREGVAQSNSYVAFALQQTGRLAEAEAASTKALAIWRDLGQTRSVGYAMALGTHALVEQYRGQLEEARGLYAEQIGLYEALGDAAQATNVRLNIAELEFDAGDPRAALEVAEAAAATFRRFRNPAHEGNVRANIAAYQITMGNLDGAFTSAREALSLAQKAQTTFGASAAIQHLATLAALRGDVRRAARLLGYVDASFCNEGYEREHTERRIYEILMTALRERLTGSEIKALAAEGAFLTADQAADDALAV
jgi:predicted ATPase/class 3 adenylate cyclase